MVYRIYSEKRPEFSEAAEGLTKDIREFLGIRTLEGVRIINRYDAEGVDEATFNACIETVFSEPQVDRTYTEAEFRAEICGNAAGAKVFAVEYLPGQFDQRADSAAQCISLVAQCERPAVRSAAVYMLSGSLTSEELNRIKAYIINPVDSREAALERCDTLAMRCDEPAQPPRVKLFDTPAKELIALYGLAMDEADAECLKVYFKTENREPTLTELRVIDTYWSDHCRHTTFNTHLTDVEFEDERVRREFENYLALRESIGDKKPVCLMDIACVAAKALKKSGELRNLDESDEINACTVKIKVDADGVEEPWLLLFKNETHNHPTEIEPFGGAATCIGGAIRDPLSGRSYVYHAMRVTGGANPLAPIESTIRGKLPKENLLQRRRRATAPTAIRSALQQALWMKFIMTAILQSIWKSVLLSVRRPNGMSAAKNPLRAMPLSFSAEERDATAAAVQRAQASHTTYHHLKHAERRFKRAMRPRNANCKGCS